MRRNNSYSIQRINPNISSEKHYRSRVQASPKSRLVFPASKDSGYYGGVGRKHYQKSTEFIHKLILNPSYNPNQVPMQRSKSEGHLKYSQQQTLNQQNKKSPNVNLNNKLDSLSILEQQFSKKLSTQNSPQKLVKQYQKGVPSSDIYQKKQSLLNSKSNSQFNIFASVDKLYEELYSPNSGSNGLNSINRIRYNPTYISSDLGYV